MWPVTDERIRILRQEPPERLAVPGLMVVAAHRAFVGDIASVDALSLCTNGEVIPIRPITCACHCPFDRFKGLAQITLAFLTPR
jgi:hypothetical protein